MRFLGKKKVACLSPHPDDCEFSISGSILKFTKTDFSIFNFTKGGKYDNVEELLRISEVKKFWLNIPNSNLNFLDVNRISNIKSDDFIYEFENSENWNFKNYDLILTPPRKDTHQDHRVVNELAFSLARQNNIGLVEYMTPSTELDWASNLFIDINDQYRYKKYLFESFKSQNNKSYFNESALNPSTKAIKPRRED